ncbi:hypothetical protein GGX14DRAFT_469087 [Mycena pura]|uniref:Band 7 domain-containing protein n=1 Tax=Mycena pura TaxID=153505 RepID=A0AAD6V024_9AGAR|nr:hypothetical protein GGX14DRAFT_469087 [Mycena pura]
MNAQALRRSALRTVSKARPSGAVVPRRTFVTIIKQGREGWQLSLGRDPVRLTPGLNLNIPIYHSLQKIDLRESSISIPNLPGYTSDNVPVTCSGSLFYRIVDGYKACFAVSDVQSNIRNTGTSAMRSVLGHFTYDQACTSFCASCLNELNSRLNKVIGNSIAVGVPLENAIGIYFSLSSQQIAKSKYAHRALIRQLELQMEAERNRRKQLLDTQANINIAEGQKQRVILESEGHVRLLAPSRSYASYILQQQLAAKANEADAAYKTVVREAEARKQQALMEAAALAQQIEGIAEAIAPPNSTGGLAERKHALSALVELRRLEQLRAIAHGAGNSTYFFGDRAALGLGAAGEAYNVDYAEHVKGGLATKGRTDMGAVGTL